MQSSQLSFIINASEQTSLYFNFFKSSDLILEDPGEMQDSLLN